MPEVRNVVDLMTIPSARDAISDGPPGEPPYQPPPLLAVGRLHKNWGGDDEPGPVGPYDDLAANIEQLRREPARNGDGR
jgi:hypothetical protein